MAGTSPDFLGQFIDLVLEMLGKLLISLSFVSFTVFGIQVNMLAILLSFLVICFVISAFWRGSKA